MGASYYVLAAAERSTQEAPIILPIIGREFTPNRQPGGHTEKGNKIYF